LDFAAGLGSCGGGSYRYRLPGTLFGGDQRRLSGRRFAQKQRQVVVETESRVEITWMSGFFRQWRYYAGANEPHTPFFETHGGKGSPRLMIQHLMESHGLPDAAQVRRISREVALPEAGIRGALSYYSDLHHAPHATRVCLGTSCVLAGAKDLLAVASERTACRPVYCIGFCDRSPAALRSDDRAVALNGAIATEAVLNPASPEPSRPTIRSVAKETIVTRRIGRGESSPI
jgi:hypothetical protein